MSKNRWGTMILSVVVALSLSAFLAAPAFAHHKDGHDNGGGSAKNQEPEPDPTPSQAPPATKGPTECPDYSQEEGGPYDHDNCDGSQGMHGNGGNGKCAGCTGKADDKSPGGQYPGDHNNGYECDHNNGVGKGNPAHSRCSASEPPIVCVGSNCGPPANVCPPGSDMAGRPPGVTGCDVDQRVDKVCPAGTDRAGEDMRTLKDCNKDSVLPNLITRPSGAGSTAFGRPGRSRGARRSRTSLHRWRCAPGLRRSRIDPDRTRRTDPEGTQEDLIDLRGEHWEGGAGRGRSLSASGSLGRGPCEH